MFFKKKKEEKIIEGSLSEFPNLMRIKPKESYVFKSNHYTCDGNYFRGFWHDSG